jgi:hypothetical protein
LVEFGGLDTGVKDHRSQLDQRRILCTRVHKIRSSIIPASLWRDVSNQQAASIREIGGLDTSQEEHAGLLDHRWIYHMRKPFCVTILLWLVLSLTVWSGLRLYSAIRWWSTIREFASPPGPLYIAVSGGFWLIASLFLFWGMWQSTAWIRFALLGTGAGLTVWYWGDRLLLQNSSVNWPFALLFTVISLAVLLICTFAPGTITFFSKREAHD